MNLYLGNNKVCPIITLIQVKCGERWYKKSKRGPGGKKQKKNKDSL